MQANQIKIGDTYAINYKGNEVALRVTGTRQEKDGSSTTNYVLGYLTRTDPNEDPVKIIVEVKAVIDEISKHDRLNAEIKAARDKRDAEVAADKAKQREVIAVLAEAIGAKPLFKGRYGGEKYSEDEPYVVADSGRVEFNPAAFDRVIALIKRAEEGKVFRMRVGPSVPAFKAPEDAQ